MTRAFLILSNTLGAGLIAIASFLGGNLWLAGVTVLSFCFWIYALLRGWDWFANPYLFLLFGLIVAGFLIDLRPGLLFPAAFLSLAGWDLSRLNTRLRLVGGGEDASRIQSRHLLRLGLVLVVGAGLLGVALTIQLELTFEWFAVLAVLAAWGLGRLIYRLLMNR